METTSRSMYQLVHCCHTTANTLSPAPTEFNIVAMETNVNNKHKQIHNRPPVYCAIYVYMGDNKVPYNGDHSGYGLSQRETALHCNVVSLWLSPYSEWSLHNGYLGGQTCLDRQDTEGYLTRLYYNTCRDSCGIYLRKHQDTFALFNTMTTQVVEIPACERPGPINPASIPLLPVAWLQREGSTASEPWYWPSYPEIFHTNRRAITWRVDHSVRYSLGHFVNDVIRWFPKGDWISVLDISVIIGIPFRVYTTKQSTRVLLGFVLFLLK